MSLADIFSRQSSDMGQQQTSIFDMGQLAQLKRAVEQTGAGDLQAKQKQVAKQFEALFLQMMIKQMRQSTPKNPLFHSQADDMWQSMADEQMGLNLAQSGGIGLAKSLLAEMQRQNPAAAQAANEVVDPSTMALVNASTPPVPLQSGRRLTDILAMLRANQGGDQSATVDEDGSSIDVAGFVARMSSAANAASQLSGVPASLILGQAALESGWGKRDILNTDGTSSHNLFGIKAGPNWKGKVVQATTTEYVDGVPRKMVQTFRSYDSYQEAFDDYAQFISNNPRYRHVTQAASDDDAAHRIQRAGYATDPNYASKLIRIMGQMRASILSGLPSGGSRP
ncbi:flagellar assembly peptidoglycan hydrolase FlgJ [Bordetella sp. FB-8]|uniref:flagellar assembly peptidoglycan hydrolase FlgJ n=1 Tax=Bordetella sp. FB-8 TaxID=1159870 RepID=UPI00035C4966|nr:flagellar assembly peptidoglycan hydrolase FlgJ [Bordetella sp. FB-8]